MLVCDAAIHVNLFCSQVTRVSSKGTHIPSIKPSIEAATKTGAIEMACVGDAPVY